MSFDLSLGKLTKIDKQNMSILDAGSSHYKVGIVIGKRNQIVDFIFLKSEGFNDVLNFHTEEVNKEDLVIESHHYLVLPDSDLLYF
jgi:hypothetical protein